MGVLLRGTAGEGPGSEASWWTVAAWAALFILLGLLLRERRAGGRLRREAAELLAAAARFEKLRAEERKGRTRAEQQLRAALAGGATAGTDSGASGDKAGLKSGGALEAEEADGAGFVFHPIGTFRSCYRSRCGTPRQGGIVTESLAVLRCTRDLNPAAALEGFSSFSHCWVLYVFHENTNLPREGRTLARRRGQRKGRVPLWQGICMKVAPPRCPNLRVGVLSCRTPHRPNPIGLSLARVVRVDPLAGEVVLGGLDVVDGTPCLDLKPYLPSYECVPAAAVPSWVMASYEEPLMRVEWAPVASSELTALLQGPGSAPSDDGAGAEAAERVDLRPFASEEDLRRALQGTLALDIRSPLQKKLHPNPALAPSYAGSGPEGKAPFFTGDLWFHELHVTYSLLPEVPVPGAAPASVRVEHVEPRPESPVAGDGAVAEGGPEAAEGGQGSADD